MKVLNLYAGIGGNRKLWTDCEVTAVELNEEVAKVYQDFFPHDKVIVADAHQYLLDHFNEYDFIWSSPPCPKNSSARYRAVIGGISSPEFPDFKLYEEAVFLKYHFKGKWVLENPPPYYPPFLTYQKVGRHLIWSNFNVPFYQDKVFYNEYRDHVPKLEKELNISLKKYSIKNKRKILRNCVHPETGLHIFNCAKEIYQKSNTEQLEMEF